MNTARATGLFVALLTCLAACAPAGQADVEPETVRQSVSSELQSATRTKDVAALKAAVVACQANSSTVGRYRAPLAGEASVLEQFVLAFSAGKPATLPAGFKSVVLSKDVTLVCQKTNRGGGAYLVRTGKGSDLIVEAPHTLFDLGTLDVALELFTRLEARAVLVDTVHRYKGAGCSDRNLGEDDEGCASDMAHSQSSFFQAVHQGLLGANSSSLVLQVHGFAPRAQDPDVIVSSADTAACWSNVADKLNENLPSYLTFEYPEDIHELGGTRGVQARHTRNVGGRMMHLELSKRLRVAITSDAQVAFDFSRAVATGMTSEGC